MIDEIKTNDHVIIFNGGKPLEGCPKSWDDAHKWEDKANAGKDEYSEPKWKWDCGFKLDFDGSLIEVSSRFYPPKEHYRSTWDGTVSLFICGKIFAEKEFDCKTLDELQIEVENYVKNFIQILKQKLIKE